MFELKPEEKESGQTPPRRPLFAAEPTPARRVAEGAMLVATAVIFGLSFHYLPVLWLAAMFLWPVPLALLVRRFGPGFGLLGAALTAVLLALFIGPLNAVFMLLHMGGVGFWYGWAARQGIHPWLSVITGIFIAAASILLILLFPSWLGGIQINDLIAQIDQIADLYVNTLQSRGQLQQVSGGLSPAEFSLWLKNYMASMLPALLICTAMAQASICYAVNVFVFRRLGYAVAKLPPFKEWRLPWYTLWGLIIALLAFVAWRQTELAWCQALYNNVMYIYQPLLMLAGLALFYWLAEFWRMPWLIMLLVIMAVFAFSAAGPMLMLLGLTDSVWDMRQMLRRRQNRL